MAVKWLEHRCPVCGSKYRFPEGVYQPQTCNRQKCIHANAQRVYLGGAAAGAPRTEKEAQG